MFEPFILLIPINKYAFTESSNNVIRFYLIANLSLTQVMTIFI